MAEILAVILAIVLGLLGIEKYKGKKKDRKIQVQSQEIRTEKIKAEISQEAMETTVEISQEIEKAEESQEIRDQEIREAEDEEELLEIAQAIFGNFNRRATD